MLLPSGQVAGQFKLPGQQAFVVTPIPGEIYSKLYDSIVECPQAILPPTHGNIGKLPAVSEYSQCKSVRKSVLNRATVAEESAALLIAVCSL